MEPHHEANQTVSASPENGRGVAPLEGLRRTGSPEEEPAASAESDAAGIFATRASYSAVVNRAGFPGPIGERGAELPGPELTAHQSVLYAAPSALRWDLFGADTDEPSLSILRSAAHPVWLVDHRAKTYRVLELSSAVRDPAREGEIAAEGTPFGPALRFRFALGGGAELTLSVLQTVLVPALATWWDLVLPGMAPRRQRARLPFRYELRVERGGEPTARMELRSMEEVRLPASLFQPPEGYRLQQDPGGTRILPLPPYTPPRGGAGLPRESAIAALLFGGGDEQVKLQLRDDVVERLRSAVNTLTGRLETFAGDGLELDLQPLLEYLAMPGPATPAGMPAVANQLLLRVLFWHFGLRLKRVLQAENLRDALRRVTQALADGAPDADQILPDPPVSAEDLELYLSFRDFVVSASGVLVPFLVDLRDRDNRTRYLDSITLGSWIPTPTDSISEALRIPVARAWFAHQFGSVSLQPEVGLTQEGGRSRGWKTNGYVAEGLGELIDMDLEIGSVTLDFARQAVLSPTQLVDETDARFQLIDTLTQTTSPGTKKRAGFVTSLRLDRLRVSGNLQTTPTTNSAAVAALLLLQPQELLKLWNHVQATINVEGLTADVLVYLEQDRLSPAGPALKLWVGPVTAESHSVAGWTLSPDPLLQSLGTFVVNVVLDHVTPALIDRVRLRIAGALDHLSGLLEESAAGLVFGSGTPPAPRRSGGLGRTVQEATSRGFALRDEIRLQHLLNLNREDEFERLTGNVELAQSRWNAAFTRLDALWQEHLKAAKMAEVDVPPVGINPRLLPRPLRDRAGMELSEAEIAALQVTYDPWAEQIRVVNMMDVEVREANAALQEFRDGWPEGQTACEVMGEPDGYRIGVAICRPGAPATGRALVYPPVGAAQSGDLTLLISARTFSDMTRGTGFAYRGDVRMVADGSPSVLPLLPALDWWRDAEEPERLGPRPTDLRDGPPPLPPGPPSSEPVEWRGYWSVIDVGGRSARLLPVNNPAPTEPVAEILIGVTVMVGVTTYTAVAVERCGPDLTRLAGELERPPLSDPGRFRPPVGPGGPRPEPGRPSGMEVETGFRRVQNPLEPTIVTASTLEDARIRSAASTDGGGLLDLPGVHFSRAGLGGAYDAHCRVVTAWDVVDREVWLSARLELRLPVYLGFGNVAPDPSTNLPGAHLLGTRAGLPILTYRFATEPVTPIGPFSIEASGPLAGLAEGRNRAWLETLMANHALAQVGNSTDRRRQRDDSPLYFAYGAGGTAVLLPENFPPFLFLAMHPTHWSGSVPPPVTDQNPPYLGLRTFGTNPDALNLAVNLYITENLLAQAGA